jgi:NAD(P)-dependent dehydrogenase (short-subunit alcohol dehydrogenase family)
VFPGMTAPPYGASKHAVVAITEDLYTSLRDGGIPVSSPRSAMSSSATRPRRDSSRSGVRG